MYRCRKCDQTLDDNEAYEYRGVFSCEAHFDEIIQDRDLERHQIIKEETAKTAKFKGLDLSDSVIGKANRSILKPELEIAAQESIRLRQYEGRA